MLGAATVRPMVERLLPGAHVLTRPRLSQLTFAGEKKTDPPAAPLGDRRVLGRGGLRDRRADPPPARRRGGGAGRAVAAHAQCAGRALSVRRRRIPGRDRRHRHGAQSRRRSRRLRRRPQVRRLSVPQAQSGRAGADRRPRRPRHPRRHLRHHRPLPAVRDRGRAGAGEPFVRAAQAVAVAQHRARFHLRRRIAGLAVGGAARRTGSPARRSPRTSWCSTMPSRDDDVRGHGDRRRRRSRGCGRSARSRTTARSRPPPTPSWR